MAVATGERTSDPAEDGGRRARPLVLVATPDEGLAKRIAEEVRQAGFEPCIARSAAGCLRVATAVGPDLVLLDAGLPARLERLLGAHPATARTPVARLESHTRSKAGGSHARMRSFGALMHTQP